VTLPTDRPSLWRVLAAPWVFVVFPSRAAQTVVNGSRPAFALLYGSGLLIYAATIASIVFVSETVVRRWVFDTNTGQGHLGVERRTLAEVFVRWHAESEVFGADVILLNVALVVIAATILAAWLFLPTVYRSGPPWAAYRRTLRAVAAGWVIVWAATLVMGMAMAIGDNLEDDGLTGIGDFIPFLIFGILVSLAGLVAWLAAACRAVATEPLVIDWAPRCEDCGYDLTHVPGDGLCPECGSAAAPSLTPGARRPGVSWQNKGRFEDLFRTIASVACGPRRFYARLKLRGMQDEAARFARINYLLIALGAGVWMTGVGSLFIPNFGDMDAWIVPLVTFVCPLVGWALHHAVGAVAASFWIIRRVLPDPSWARIVIAYEAAYLWTFCAFNGAFATSMFVNDDWLSDFFEQALGTRYVLGLFPPEALLFLTGNGLLILNWLRRYHVAALAVRWSNY